MSGITRSSDDRPNTSNSTVKPPRKKKTGDDSYDNNTFFIKCINGVIGPSTIGYASFPSKNKLSEKSINRPSAKAILQKAKKSKYNALFSPLVTLSHKPEENVVILKVNTFPPDDEFQNLAEDGACSTKVKVGVTPAPEGKDVHEIVDCPPQSPSYHAMSTVDNRVIGWKCGITEAQAQLATTESTAYLDIHPFLGPYDQADKANKDTKNGKRYKAMRDKFDKLVMEHILDVITCGLLPNLKIITIHGSDTWDFMTVKFPREFPDEYKNTILPLIIQHSPLIHGTVISAYAPTFRQGYTYCEGICNVVDHLQGSRDYHNTLIKRNLPPTIFSYFKTKYDNQEGDDDFFYIGRFDGYDGGEDNDGDEDIDEDIIVFARDRTHLEQLLRDEVDGVGWDNNLIPKQKELKKSPQLIKSKSLRIEIHHFNTYIQNQGSQMKLSDFGYQNREGAYKAWKAELAEEHAKKQAASKKGFANRLGGLKWK